MADTRPKHKPNEKHTLDEVLKSLRDLVSNEVLDQPPAAPPTRLSKPASGPATPADMRNIINSLEELLRSDLDDDDKPKPAVAAVAPVTPTRDATPPPPVAPMFDDEEALEMETPAETVPPLTFPEEMTDEDIAKALADIELIMEAAPAPATDLNPEPEFVEADEEVTLAPAPEVALSETEIAQATEETAESAPELEAIDAQAAETPITDTEIVEAEAPALELTMQEPATDTEAPKTGEQQELALDVAFGAMDTGDSAGLPTIDVDEAPLTAEEEAAFASSFPTKHAAILNEIQAAPHAFEAAPLESADAETATFAPDADLIPAEELVALAELIAEEPATPASTNIVEYTPTATPSTRTRKLEKEASPEPAESLTPPLTAETSATDDAILERAEPPGMAADVNQTSKSLSSDVEIDLGVTAPQVTLTLHDLDLSPSPTPAASAPATPAETPHDDIPVLENVALAPPPATKPAPVSAEHMRDVSIKVIARLNIELRKAGKQPLDAKAIHRLQQLLRESLDQGGKK